MTFKPVAIEGSGIGIRHCHYKTVLDTLPAVPWFEALTDNYLYNETETHLFNRHSRALPHRAAWRRPIIRINRSD